MSCIIEIDLPSKKVFIYCYDHQYGHRPAGYHGCKPKSLELLIELERLS